MPSLVFCCTESNDLYRAVVAGGTAAPRVQDPADAVARADPGTAVLVLADGYPGRRAEVPDEVYAAAADRGILLYVEYPAHVPGVELGEPQTATWERLVVTGDRLAPDLPDLTLLAAHACRYLPATSDRTLLALARVAGYDRAVFGVPADAHAALFEASEGVVVATTKLSGFRTGRYAPVATWTALWNRLLAPYAPGAALSWTPVVTPSLAAGEPVDAAAERTAVERAVRWHATAGVLLTTDGERAAREVIPTGVEAVPRGDLPSDVGDGSHGVLEGFESSIRLDGTQHCRVALRADCSAETAMVLASGDAASERRVAANLLDYVYTGASGMCAGGRGDPAHPAYGLIAWGVGSRPWEIANYGDDNARVLLASLLASERLGDDRWTEPVLRAVLANLRTTGVRGFRGDRIDMPELSEHGWRHYHERDVVNRSPHFEAYLWACYLWAYRVTGDEVFLPRTTAAIAAMMAAYPGGWRRNDTTERARMLLPLAWLVRVDDTPEHRGWLTTVAADLVRDQQDCGGLPEHELGGPGLFHVPHTNEEYGESESPLVQQDGDPATDQLYTGGFALLGLHEAAAVVDEPWIADAERRLAAYLVRVQTRSDLPWLDGAWLRAFDYERWDYWSSSGDLGWGAWCMELGWAPAWATATLGLRARGESLWDAVTRVVPKPDAAAALRTQLLDLS